MAVDWQVETLRITAFPNDVPAVSVSKLWDSVIGEEPDEVHIQRDSIDARAIGFGNGRMVLAKQTDRVDWRYLSSLDNGDEGLVLPIIGQLETELKTFVKLANDWFVSSEMPVIKRLAFGAVLLHPVFTVEEGFSILQDLLPALNLRNVRDFNYQINRRRNSRIDPRIEVNRLSKWNVYKGKVVTVAIDVEQEHQVSTATDMSIACRLELDMNTFPERIEPLPIDSLPSTFDELLNLGLEISEKGDIA